MKKSEKTSIYRVMRRWGSEIEEKIYIFYNIAKG
jgi:hypothetical protein